MKYKCARPQRKPRAGLYERLLGGRTGMSLIEQRMANNGHGPVRGNHINNQPLAPHSLALGSEVLP